jgi:hypothetical protein
MLMRTAGRPNTTLAKFEFCRLTKLSKSAVSALLHMIVARSLSRFNYLCSCERIIFSRFGAPGLWRAAVAFFWREHLVQPVTDFTIPTIINQDV